MKKIAIVGAGPTGIYTFILASTATNSTFYFYLRAG